MIESGHSWTGRARVRLIAALGALGALVALGVVSLYRQATTVRFDPGFAVVDQAGTIQVEPGEAGEEAGLESGDVLLAIGGEPVQGPFDWNRRFLEGPLPASLTIDVARGTETLRVVMPVRVRRGADPLDIYLALVGFFFIATAAVAAFRTARSGLTWRYGALSVALFAMLAISDLPSATSLDWTFFFLDRFGRLTFPAFLLIFARALTRSEPGGWRADLALLAPPALLAAAGVLIHAGAARGMLRDPLSLWTIKDRVEFLVGVVYVLASLARFAASATREHAPSRRYQVRWAFWGSVVGFAPLTCLYLLPYGVGIQPPRWTQLSALTMAVLPLTLSSTLFRYRPGDLELYIRRAIGALSIVFLTFAASSAAWVLIDRVGRRYLEISDWFGAGAAALIGALLYPKIRSLTNLAMDRLIYGGRSPFRRTLLSFGRELNAELDLDSLVRKFEERTRQTLDLTSTMLLVRHDREGVLRPIGAAGPTVDADSPLVERARDVSYLLLDDLAHAPGAETLDPLRTRGIHYLFPMKVKGQVRAVLATGPRRGGAVLASEDVELLVALCGHAAVALENARLMAQLHGKVDEVEKLRRYNEDILQSSRIGILVVDDHGVIQAINDALAEIYGVTREEAVGRTLGEVFPLPLVRHLSRKPEDAAEESEMRRLYRYALTDRAGRKIVVNVSRSKLATGQGDRGGHVITFDDVTDQVKLEEQLLRQDRLASIGLLASGVAHEVNTPLTGISSYTQMLLAELDESDPRREVLLKIERQTFRAASIVNSLLNFTRDGTGATEAIGVGDLVNESLALFEPQLRGGSIRIERHVEDALPPLQGHRGKLQQVLLNLLLNARDAIATHGTIRVAARRAGSRLVLEIADDGEGIAEEDIGKIFDPFFTTKPRGRGTGLGLSLSYNIVHEHQGEISVESRRGEGTVFTIDIPFETRDAVHA